VAAGGEKFAETRGGIRDRVGRGDADNVEAVALAVSDDPGFRLAGVSDQKSRSA
jgi:hypothetical protein